MTWLELLVPPKKVCHPGLGETPPPTGLYVGWVNKDRVARVRLCVIAKDDYLLNNVSRGVALVVANSHIA